MRLTHAVLVSVVGAALAIPPFASAQPQSSRVVRVGGCPPGWTADKGSTSMQFTCRPPLPPAGFKCPEGMDMAVDGCSFRCFRRPK
jgi:hypothetical protein